LLNVEIVVMAQIICAGVVKIIFDPDHMRGAILKSIGKIPGEHSCAAKSAKNKNHMLSVIFSLFIAILNWYAINNFSLLCHFCSIQNRRE